MLISLVVRFALAGLAGQPAPRTNSPAARPSNTLPTKIITTDGKVYNAVRLLKIQPDGLLIEYRPDTGGIGMGNLKFAKLPASLQKQFGYDPLKASAFEHEQAQVTAALVKTLRQDEKTRIAVLNDMSERPNLTGAVSVNSSDPTVSYTYYAPGQKPEAVGEYTAVTVPNFTCHADFTFHDPPNAPGQPVRLIVDTVKISLGLSCHIIEPEHPYEFVSRHEDGHRKICEYFYRFGPQVANDIGKSVIGQGFASTAPDVEAAKAEILPRAEFLVEAQYTARIDGPAMAANRYYDQLNDPEGVHLDVNQAVQKAIAKYSDQVNAPTQMPAGAPDPDNPVVSPPNFQATPPSLH
jgi:hypothetical protein